MTKVGFIGAGNMASAIINGIINKELYSPSSIYVFDIDKVKVDSFVLRGINGVTSAGNLTKECDIIFLAVKPQNFNDVLPLIKADYLPSKIVVSIAAGISTAFIKSFLGEDAKVIRTMPNTPLMLGYGATAMSHVSPVTDNEFASIRKIFEAVGVSAVVSEDKMNEVVSVNGSSPAYVYLFAKAMIDSAVSQGIDGDTAASLIFQSILGSAYMLIDSGSTPEELIKMVSSPGGTTLRALESFEATGYAASVDTAMKACTQRSKELSGE